MAHERLKWLVALDVDRQLILAQAAHRGPRRDANMVAPLLAAAPAVQALVATRQLGWLVADREFDSEALHVYAARTLHARTAIPVMRVGGHWIRGRYVPATRYRARMAAALPTMYRRRVLAETLFSAIKRTQGGTAPGRRAHTQVKQAHLVGISYDLARLEQLTTQRAA
ncbi:MAG: transposase [Gemmatirosa sp.]